LMWVIFIEGLWWVIGRERALYKKAW